MVSFLGLFLTSLDISFFFAMIPYCDISQKIMQSRAPLRIAMVSIMLIDDYPSVFECQKCIVLSAPETTIVVASLLPRPDCWRFTARLTDSYFP